MVAEKIPLLIWAVHLNVFIDFLITSPSCHPATNNQSPLVLSSFIGALAQRFLLTTDSIQSSSNFFPWVLLSFFLNSILLEYPFLQETFFLILSLKSNDDASHLWGALLPYHHLLLNVTQKKKDRFWSVWTKVTGRVTSMILSSTIWCEVHSSWCFF